MDLEKGYALSQYEELGKLNGNASVWIVRNSITGKIAVKKIMSAEQKKIYAFLKSRGSKYTPEIYECAEDGEKLIVIEEYFEGRNLEDILYEERMNAKEACCIVSDLCCALEPLHMAEPAIICRDLKPENIVITPQKDVKLIDFDIARTVSHGKRRDTVVMGTRGFAAPEQWGYAQTDGRADIYALGVLLNYCILRKLPSEEMLGGLLGNVIERCTALSPDDRYQNVAELKAALEEIYSAEKKGDEKARNAVEGHGILRAQSAELEREAEKTSGWRRFLPPGFRSGEAWKMVVAVLGYLMILNLSVGLDLQLTGGRAFIEKSVLLIAYLTETGIVFNYMGCQRYVPFLNTENRLLKGVIYIAVAGILVVVAAMLCTLLEMLIWG